MRKNNKNTGIVKQLRDNIVGEKLETTETYVVSNIEKRSRNIIVCINGDVNRE